MDEDEAVVEVPDYVANRKDLPVKDRIVGLLAHYLERVLVCVLLLVVIGHILGELVALRLRFHPDKNYLAKGQPSIISSIKKGELHKF